MHDKQVRRRRAVLGLLVAASLILLTAYFGESPTSPLHSIQRGIVEVFSPVQKGASKVLAPVRDIAGWFSDTINAKSENARLNKENASLTQKLDHLQYLQFQYNQLSALVKLDDNHGIDAYDPLAADVIGRDPILWYQTIEVDKGSDDGVEPNDPVIADDGLVGDISFVGPNYSFVTELTDDKYAVAAQVQDSAGDTGILQPLEGDPNDLVLGSLPSHAQILPDDQVVTAGFSDTIDRAITDLYPPGIPIGYVSNFNAETLANDQQVQVSPFVDLRHISVVQILTKPDPSSERAELP